MSLYRRHQGGAQAVRHFIRPRLTTWQLSANILNRQTQFHKHHNESARSPTLKRTLGCVVKGHLRTHAPQQNNGSSPRSEKMSNKKVALSASGLIEELTGIMEKPEMSPRDLD